MQVDAIVQAMSRTFPRELCTDLLENFLQLRGDVSTGTLGRGSPGKFVETGVQMLQHLLRGTIEAKTRVDSFITMQDASPGKLPDDLRICMSRILRAMYALRNKRNISHKGEVDSNRYDLAFLFHAAQC